MPELINDNELIIPLLLLIATIAAFLTAAWLIGYYQTGKSSQPFRPSQLLNKQANLSHKPKENEPLSPPISDAIIDKIELLGMDNKSLMNESMLKVSQKHIAIIHADKLIGKHHLGTPLSEIRHSINQGLITEKIQELQQLVRNIKSQSNHVLDMPQQQANYCAVSLIYFASISWVLNHIEDAITYYKHALNFDDKNPEIYLRLTELYDTIEDPLKTEYYKRKAIDCGIKKHDDKLTHITQENIEYTDSKRDKAIKNRRNKSKNK